MLSPLYPASSVFDMVSGHPQNVVVYKDILEAVAVICKWRDHAAQCTVQDSIEPEEELDYDHSDHDNDGDRPSSGGLKVQVVLYSAANNPIVIN